MKTTKLLYTIYFSLINVVAFSQLPIVNGWTQFTASSDSRIIYVSDTEGDDATAEFYSPSAPEVGTNPFLPTGVIKSYKTINAAKNELRNGFPDWILLKKGDVFTDQAFGTLNINGKNASEPLLIGSYGSSSERPQILSGIHGFISFSGAASHVAIVGLYARPHLRMGNDDPTALNILNAPFTSFLVEDCYFDEYCIQLVVQDYSGASTYSHSGFTARRNIIANGYQIGGGGGGVYMHHIDNILFEENLIDHNGWSSTISGANPTGFSHNTYFQSSCQNLTFRNNIVSRASAVGIGARCGGIVENNLLLANPRSVFVGSFDPAQINWPTEGVGGSVKHNVVLNPRVETFDPGNGITIDRVIGLDVEKNIVAHFDETSNYNTAIGLNNFQNVNLHKNIVYNWGNNQTSGVEIGNGISLGTSRLGANLIDSNDLQLENTQSYCVNSNGSFSTLTFYGNRYHNVTTASNWFSEGNYSAWISASGETNALQENVAYTDPNRNIASYMIEIGGTGALDEFLEMRKLMNKDNWDERYTAMEVNDYIREGFDLDQLNTVSISAIEPVKILVFPNPVVDQLTIDVDRMCDFVLYNSLGGIVQNGKLNIGKQILDLVSVNAGIYQLRIDSQVKKIVVVK